MASDGTVKVAVRVRPLNRRENGMKAKSILKMQGGQTILSNPKNELDVKTFTYDFSYDSQDNTAEGYATQGQIYTDLGEDVITSAFEGYNACVFAYGQTGSGKSYSMMGGHDDIGLIPRICTSLFDKTESHGEAGTKYSAEVSYLEIYNEKVKDLLTVPIPPGSPGKKAGGGGSSPTKGTPRKGKGKGKGKAAPSPRRKAGSTASLRVRENPQSGPYVEGLSVHKVTCADEINGLMEIGNAARTVAATNMNDTSSRSHALFTIRFTQASFVAGIPAEKSSKLNLVDLAGSERTSSTGATGVRLKEGGSINKSLTTLGIVINELAKRTTKGSHIPYRDSVLTWLLRESLGGNSKTIMLAAISPADVNYGETLSTLHYANRAKNIVNKPIVNEDENVRIIKELRKEVEELKKMILNGGGAELDAKIKQSESLVTELTDEFSARWNVSKRVLESNALTLDSKGISVSLETGKPHLVNLNLHDSLASGVTLHYLKDPITTIGRGAPGSVDVLLSGLDAADKHCTITIDSPTEVTLTPEDGVCIVNGARIEQTLALRQGMQLTFGQQNVFRFNHPVQAKQLRQLREDGLLNEDDPLPPPPPPQPSIRVSPLTTAGDGVGATSGGEDDAVLATPAADSNDPETLRFRLLELEAEQEAQQSRESLEKAENAKKTQRLKELEAIVRRQSMEAVEVAAAGALTRSPDGVGRLQRSNSLVRRPDGAYPAVGLRAGSENNLLLAADLAEAETPTLETLDAYASLLSIVVGFLDLSALTQLRVVSKRMLMQVDTFLPYKRAFLGWDALLEGIDADAWEFRLDYMPIGVLDRDFVRKTFRACCKEGSTTIAQKVAKAFKITHLDVMHEEAGPLRDACRYGHQPLALWLADEYELNRSIVRARDNYCIGTACQFGHIDVVNWLCDVRFGLTLADIRADDNFALRYAAMNGHLYVIEFLLDRFAFTLSDIKTDSFFAVRIACQKGFDDIAKCLFSHFRLRPEDLRCMGNYALHNACVEGHVAVVDWLLYDVGLERRDILNMSTAANGTPFLAACTNGHYEVAMLLADAGEITTADVRSRRSEVFRLCCEEGQQEMCEWLASDFELSIDDVREMEYYAVRKTHANGYEALKMWLIGHFQLTSDDAIALRPHLV